eukprot:TRINITY_DN8849_c0_g1_i2.p1 TRINITY_DN8849_c0_g1~~TRINITY_DN8849_c0_g1_i2.p1  ORF type:complete len:230 (-),score=42.76 TRINITY_DN8849_c0_g1_i2:92-781(-)
MNQIYVHAKVMIVDDRVCICGSANINERSQLGSRDSELAYRILPPLDNLEGDLEIKMNGKPHMATKFAHSLRRSLWAEHLGIEDELSGRPGVEFIDDMLGDPVCDGNYKSVWLKVAQANTAICRKFFLEQPGNHHCDLETYNLCRSVADYEINPGCGDAERQYRENVATLRGKHELEVQPRAQALKHLERLRGHLYEYPLYFLNRDLMEGNLKPSFGDAEGVIPAMTFT